MLFNFGRDPEAERTCTLRHGELWILWNEGWGVQEAERKRAREAVLSIIEAAAGRKEAPARRHRQNLFSQNAIATNLLYIFHNLKRP